MEKKLTKALKLLEEIKETLSPEFPHNFGELDWAMLAYDIVKDIEAFQKEEE